MAKTTGKAEKGKISFGSKTTGKAKKKFVVCFFV